MSKKSAFFQKRLIRKSKLYSIDSRSNSPAWIIKKNWSTTRMCRTISFDFISLFLSRFFNERQFRKFFIFNSWIWELDFDACYLVLLVSVVYRASRPCKFIFMTIFFGDHPKLLFSLSYSSCPVQYPLPLHLLKASHLLKPPLSKELFLIVHGTYEKRYKQW